MPSFSKWILRAIKLTVVLLEAYALPPGGKVPARAILPTALEIGTKMGEGVLAFSRGYVAWKSTTTPTTLTWTGCSARITAAKHRGQTDVEVLKQLRRGRIEDVGTGLGDGFRIRCQYTWLKGAMKHVPAFAITTSSLPAVFLIYSTASLLSATSDDVSFTACTLPGCCLTRACKSVAAAGLRAPAKMTTFSRWARTVTKARPVITRLQNLT